MITILKNLKMTNKIDEYQVVVKLNQLPNPIRFTYPTNKSNVITQIEELDALENVRCSCKFKGRTTYGEAVTCQWMKDVKSWAQGLKPKDWLVNDGWIDSYYKIH